MKIFSKQKMLDRLKREGRADEVSEDALELMNILEGREAVKNDFKALVFGQLEYFVRYNDQVFPVNPNDCIEK